MTKSENKNWIFWITLLILFTLFVYTLRSVLLPFVVGIIIGYLLDPLATRLEKLKINRTLATCLVLLLVAIILIPVIISLIGMIDEQLALFINAVPKYMESLSQKIEPIINNLQDNFPNLNREKFREYLRGNMSNGLKLIGTLLRKIISGSYAVFNILSLILITPIVTFYMLRDWNSFIKKVDSLLPKTHKKEIRTQAKEIDKIISSFIRGQLSVCIILGTFYGVGLSFIGLDLGMLIGFIAGVISFIPYVGTIVGFISATTIAFAQFGDWLPIAQVIGVFAIGQFLEGNFLTPKLVGDSVGLHPVWIMFALLSGGVLLGFLGLMIAVPLAAVIGVLTRFAISKYKQSSLYKG